MTLFLKIKTIFTKLDSECEAPNYIFTKADIATFIVFNEIYSKDKSNIYYFSDITFPDLDVASFKAFTDFYFIYKSGAFYFIINDKLNIPDADYETFSALNQYYALDKNHVYHYSSVIKNADPNTFKLISKSPYNKDHKHVFM